MSALYEDDAVMAEAIRSSSLGTSEIVAAILAAGYSKPRTATEVFEIHTLPRESVIRTVQGYAMEKLSDGWHRAGVDYAYTPYPNWLPATVIYSPEES